MDSGALLPILPKENSGYRAFVLADSGGTVESPALKRRGLTSQFKSVFFKTRRSGIFERSNAECVSWAYYRCPLLKVKRSLPCFFHLKVLARFPIDLGESTIKPLCPIMEWGKVFHTSFVGDKYGHVLIAVNDKSFSPVGQCEKDKQISHFAMRNLG